MDKQYVNDEHLQIAMTEYNPNNSEIGHIVQTEQNKTVGTVSQVYNNTGHVTLPPGVKELESLTGSVTGRTMETVSGDGEQVYAVVKNPDEKADKVQESYAIL